MGMTSIVSDNPAEFRSTVLLGANGRLGRMIRAFWPADGLVAVGRQDAVGVVHCDTLAEGTVLQGILVGSEAVICLAGVTPSAARDGVDFSLNTALALATIRAAKAAGAGRVFLASSAAVYGRQSGVLPEDGECAPLSEYGWSKLEMENEGLALGLQIGQPVTVLRIGNVAGADAILGGWHADMQIDQLPSGGTPARSYIGPKTLAKVMAALVQRRELPAVLNIAAPGAVEMGALLDAADLVWKPQPAPKEVIAHVQLCTARLSRYVDFLPEAGMPSGLVGEWREFKERGL